jgi:cytochrome P450 family 4
LNPVTVFSFVEEMSKKLGDLYHLSYNRFDETLSITTNLKIVEALLTNSEELTKTADYELLVPFTGRGLLTSTNNKWIQRRKVYFKI